MWSRVEKISVRFESYRWNLHHRNEIDFLCFSSLVLVPRLKTSGQGLEMVLWINQHSTRDHCKPWRQIKTISSIASTSWLLPTNILVPRTFPAFGITQKPSSSSSTFSKICDKRLINLARPREWNVMEFPSRSATMMSYCVTLYGSKLML